MTVDQIAFPVNNRPEREHLYRWMVGEETYVEGKFTDERKNHDLTLKDHYDIDEFWTRQVNQYYDRTRMFLEAALTFRMAADPDSEERATKLEKQALQAVAKAMMTAKGFAESMIRVYGDMPKPGLSSGNVEPWDLSEIEAENKADVYAALLGKQVEVFMGEETNADDSKRRVVAQGQLLGFGQGGDFEILCDDGMIHYCWPALEMEEWTE